MPGWLNRLLGRGSDATVAPPELDAPPMPGFSAADVPDFPAERRFSVWDKLADDPGAQMLRAEWESRWDAF